MLSDINEVTEKCSSDEIDQTLSKDIFEVKENKLHSGGTSNNTSQIGTILEISVKSVDK